MSTPSIFLCIISLSLILLAESSNTECSDEAQCEGQEISDATVSCSAFESCRGSLIISNDEQNGYIECTAMSACERARKLDAPQNVYCTGFKSCYSAQFQSGEIVQCSGNSACDKTMASSSTISANHLMYCGAKQACNSARLFSGKATYCEGFQSCVDGQIHSGDFVNCDGTESCSNNELTAQNVALCSGRASCRGAEINAPQIRLYGIDSGAESEIYGAAEIEAFGYQSAQNAKIYSGVKNVTLKMFGDEAGKRAKFICQSGGICLLNCKGTACKGTEFRCLPGSTCSIKPSECEQEDYFDGVYQGIACPTITNGAPPNYQLSAHSVFDEEEEEEGDSNEIYAMSDNDLTVTGFDIAVNSRNCDEKLECDKQEIIGQEVVSCSGYRSCNEAAISNPGNTGMEVIGCYGQSSCRQSSLRSPRGYISCKGEESCVFSDLRAKHIRCSGLNSCQYVANVEAAAPMECSGTASCKAINIFNLDTTACLANRACYQSILESRHGNILCDGQYSCSEGALTAGGHVECNGKGSCHLTEITALTRVFVNGDYAAYGAQISASVIRGYGYRSLMFATIDSDHRQTMIVNAIGHLAGYGAMILCRSQSQCTLICKGSGCSGLLFVCLAGSRCMIQPQRCDGNANNNNAVDGIQCPVMSTSIPPDDEMQIIKRQKYNMAKDEIYKKYKKEIRDDEELFKMVEEFKQIQEDEVDEVAEQEMDEVEVEEEDENEDKVLFEDKILSVVQSGLHLNDVTEIFAIILAIGFIVCLLYFGYKVKFARNYDAIK